MLLDSVAPTVGIDASAEAVAAAKAAHPDGTFLCGSVEQVQGEGLLYARFLLHAIPEQAEDALLGRLEGRWSVAFEFRTPKDEMLPKVTPDHYRRPVSVRQVCNKLEACGFSTVYSVEGRGMAKYGADDAHVGRVLAERM